MTHRQSRFFETLSNKWNAQGSPRWVNGRQQWCWGGSTTTLWHKCMACTCWWVINVSYLAAQWTCLGCQPMQHTPVAPCNTCAFTEFSHTQVSNTKLAAINMARPQTSSCSRANQHTTQQLADEVGKQHTTHKQ